MFGCRLPWDFIHFNSSTQSYGWCNGPDDLPNVCDVPWMDGNLSLLIWPMWLLKIPLRGHPDHGPWQTSTNSLPWLAHTDAVQTIDSTTSAVALLFLKTLLFLSRRIFHRHVNNDRFRNIFWHTKLCLILHYWKSLYIVLGITHCIQNLLKNIVQTLLARLTNKWFVVSSSTKHNRHPFTIMSSFLQFVHRICCNLAI